MSLICTHLDGKVVYDQVEKSWYQELSQVCHYPCADVNSLYICVKTRLNILVLLLNISHIPVSKIYFPIFKECARFTLILRPREIRNKGYGVENGMYINSSCIHMITLLGTSHILRKELSVN